MSSEDANPRQGYRAPSVHTELSEDHDDSRASQNDNYQGLLVPEIVTNDAGEPMPDVQKESAKETAAGNTAVPRIKIEDPDSKFLWDTLQGAMIDLSDSEDDSVNEDKTETGAEFRTPPTEDDDRVIEVSADGSPVRIKKEVEIGKVNWIEMPDGSIVLSDTGDNDDVIVLGEGTQTPIKQEYEEVPFLWSSFPDGVIEILDTDNESANLTTPTLGNSLLRRSSQGIQRTQADPEKMKRIQQMYAARAINGRRPTAGASGIFTVPQASRNANADAADSRSSFAEIRRIYKAKRKAKKATFEDDVAFKKAQDKEMARIRRLEEDLAKEVDSDEEVEQSDDDLFMPKDIPHVASSKRPHIDLFENEDNDDINFQEGSDSKKPKTRDNLKRSRAELNKELKFNFLAGFEETLGKHKRKEEQERKNIRKAPGVKGKAGKGRGSDPNSGQTGKLLNGQQPGGKKRGRKRPTLSNIQSLTTSNVYNDANANLDVEGIPAMTGKRKKDAMASLIAAIPIGEKADMTRNRADKASIEAATKVLGNCSVRQNAEVSGGAWDLKGMVTPLYHHQVQGAGKMMSRETGTDFPPGGILADEMGLGKTLMTIATLIAHPPPVTAQHRCTLIVCSAAIISQWDDEIKKHTSPKVFGSIVKHHGQNKISSKGASGRGAVAMMERMDIVLTTYGEVIRSYPICKIPKEIKDPKLQQEWWLNKWEAKRDLLHRVHFYRVVLDEAQAIKNHKSSTSIACRALMGRHRWAVSGTPIQNGVEELFPYFKFLQIPYTGSFRVFRRNFCDMESDIPNQRLHTYLERVMIRRTHQDKIMGRKMFDIPKNTQTTIKLEFNAVEKVLYEIINHRYIQAINRASSLGVLEETKLVLRKFLRLRQMTSHLFMVQEVLERIFTIEDIERLWAATNSEASPNSRNANDMMNAIRNMIAAKDDETPVDFDADKVKVSKKDAREGGGELSFKFRKFLRKLRRGKKWKALVERSNCHKCELPPDEPLLTSCYHLYCRECLNTMAHEASQRGEDHTSCIKCEKPFSSSSEFPALEESEIDVIPEQEAEQPMDENGNKQRPHRTVKDQMRWCELGGQILPSTKSAAVQGQIEDWLRDFPTTKIIVFSQFHLFMNVVGKACEKKGWKYCTYHGKMSQKGREEAVEKFRDDPNVMIMIASLKCGGIGLNLTMAKRVICVDLWFNSSVEQQAFCRVFRIGQDEETFITRFVVKDTVDEKLLELQERKDKSIGEAMDDRSVLSNLTMVELMGLFGEVKRDKNDMPFIYVEDSEIDALIPRLTELDQDDGA